MRSGLLVQDGEIGGTNTYTILKGVRRFEGQKAPKYILDEIFPDKPVQIRRADGHATWVNSLALKLANITKDTKEVKGGIVVRDIGEDITILC